MASGNQQLEEAAAATESEQRFRALIDNLPHLAWIADADGSAVWFNKQWFEYTGTTLEAMRGWGWQTLHDPRHVRRVTENFKAAIAAGRPWEDTFPLRGKDGGYRWFLSRAYPLRNSRNRITGWIGTNTDVTEQKQAETAAAEQARLLDLTNDAIIVCDMEDRIHYWNRGAEEIYGWSRDEAIGRIKHELLHTQSPVSREEIMTALLRDNRWSGELVQTCRDGHRLTAMTRWSLDRDGNGKPVAVLKSDNDITERKRSELELASAKEALERANRELDQRVNERTAALRETIAHLETFSYSITHDMRGPLRAMSAFAQVLEDDYGPQLDAAAREYLRRIVDAAARLDRLIQDVLQYNRVARENLTFDTLNLEKLVRDVVNEYPDIAQKKAAIKIDIGCGDTNVRANLAAVTQIISNLVGNALKFVPPNRAPAVRITCQDCGDTIRMVVEDNGIGIPPELQSRIFGIFERLHGPEYPGTGIGLAIVKKAAERMGGAVGLESTPGVGSRFWVELPKAAAKVSPP